MSDSEKVWVEWIPNISTGNKSTVDEIKHLFESIDDLYVLHSDRSSEVNRTVFTIVGTTVSLQTALFSLFDFLTKNLNMEEHQGLHPRIGALDVSPYVLLKGGSLKELLNWVKYMSRLVSEKYKIPIYLYEKSASKPERGNLADIRRGEYEGQLMKLEDPDWKPDYGSVFNSRLGATVMGIRDFLIAYNVNLDTNNLIVAKRIARDIRSRGRPDRRNQLPGVKAIGWYLNDARFCQVSTNIINTKTTTPLNVYNRCRKIAKKHSCRVTGSELIGLIPFHSVKIMLSEGPYSTTSLAQNLGLQYCGIQDLRERIIEHKVYIASGNSLFNELFENL